MKGNDGRLAVIRHTPPHAPKLRPKKPTKPHHMAGPNMRARARAATKPKRNLPGSKMTGRQPQRLWEACATEESWEETRAI